jgi:hypothetical protein
MIQINRAAEVDIPVPMMERHFTLGELAEKWHMSRKYLRTWFVHEPGVIKYGKWHGRKLNLRIPESVALRVYREHTGEKVHLAS